MDQDFLLNLVNARYLLPKDIAGWRPAIGEKLPTQHIDKVVFYTSFFERGFGLPAHPLLQDLLYYHSIQVYYLNPNSILHMSIFITFNSILSLGLVLLLKETKEECSILH